MAKQTFSIRLTSELVQEIDGLAQARHVSRSRIAERIIEEFFTQERAVLLRALRVLDQKEGTEHA